ncbi:uncharacterized protein PRCAT00001414001 [Priceomyces carsonii]|uniref:uncharacterized protein n=1 Tax=Priceomyces carsonii TaxID=28549 RepID=UPI002ED9EA55|nr:unnamed protein product [Priceomyces carsonii]
MIYETTTVTVGGNISRDNFTHSFSTQTLTAILPQSADVKVEPFGIFIAVSQIKDLAYKESKVSWVSENFELFPTGATAYTEGDPGATSFAGYLPANAHVFVDEDGLYVDATKFMAKDTKHSSGTNSLLNIWFIFLTLTVMLLISTIIL